MMSLKSLNTFKIESFSKNIYTIQSIDEISNYSHHYPHFHILGGGSNILLIDDIAIPILRNQLKGIKIIYESESEIEYEVASGENWHEFVLFCVDQNYGGIENLSLIPGTVGAAPIQNIGAYGVEVKDVITFVNGFDFVKNEMKRYEKEDCEFSYRNSVFKSKLKNRFFITSVGLRLSKNPKINSSYAPVASELKRVNISAPNIKDISKIVIDIRKSKLPDPNLLGNAGSFFKNVVVDKEKMLSLLSQYSDIPNYKTEAEEYKVPTAWLIEKAGWKGYRDGDAACHQKQSLVLVNYEKATGKQILDLAHRIKNDIFIKFGINIEFEVNIWS